MEAAGGDDVSTGDAPKAPDAPDLAPVGEGQTNPTGLPPARHDEAPDDHPEPTELDADPTRLSSEVGIVAELRAILEDGSRKQLPLYRLPDQIVVGRGSGVDWRLDDSSLSRKHIQLKWNGSVLTVEDLGSANGTRVAGKPARTATTVEPGELLQIGAVSIVLELREGGEAPTRQVELPPEPAGPDGHDADFVDEPASGRTAPVAMAPVSSTVAPAEAFPALPGTFIKATEARGAAQVFRPARGYARPDEPTRPWDARAALVRKRGGAASGAWPAWSGASIAEAWRKNPRPFILGGVTALLALLLTAWWIADALAPAPAETRTARSESTAGPGPKVTSLAPPTPPSGIAPVPIVTKLDPEEPPLLSAAQRDQALADGISAYDQGHYAEALEHFEALSADGSDPAVRFMVQLLRARVEPAR